MKSASFIIILLLLLGCQRNTPQPRTYDELQVALTSAIQHHDERTLEHLLSFDDRPDLREERKLNITNFPTKEVFGYVTDIFPVWINHHLVYPKADKLILITASSGKRGEIGVLTFSLTMLVTKVDGKFKLRQMDETLDAGNDKAIYEFALTVSDGKKLAGNLKNRMPHTFAYQFTGSDFISVSMNDLASTLSTYTGFHIVDQTSITDDYDFRINFFDVGNLSTDNIALNAVGLDLKSLKQSSPNEALPPQPVSVTPGSGAPVTSDASAAHM